MSSVTRAPRRPCLRAGGARLRPGLPPLAPPGSPGPCVRTVPSGRAARATTEERARGRGLPARASRLVRPRGDLPAAAGPVRVEGRAAGRVDALVGVRAEVVALGLDQ